MNKRDYIFQRLAAGDARTVAQLAAEFDTRDTAIRALSNGGSTPAEKAAAIATHDAVNDWLAALRVSDATEFERVRRLPFSEQKTLAGI